MLHEYHLIHSVRYYPWFHVTVVGLEKYYPWIWGHYCITYSECVSVACSCTRSACAVFCQPWPAPFYSIFSHYLTNGTIFGGKKLL